jgi:biopolymer transport protein ExbD
MTAPRRFLDVWIIESNTVYREVPFTVVADWVQQGRLLEDDMLRPSGTAEWMKVGASPSFAPYLPRSVPHGVEDQAEAMEPVALDFAWKKPHPDEEEDVDMIPLIDVSLVLLIFFMMTASGAARMFVQTPLAENAEIAEGSRSVWIAVDRTRKGISSYSFGRAKSGPTNKFPLTQDQCVDQFEQMLDEMREKEGIPAVEVTIHAHEALKASEVRSLTAKLEGKQFQGKILHKYTGVREK